MSFQDHFSRDSAGYRDFRPRYPTALFEFLAGLCERHDAAWDCATGNGQAAVDLAARFERVIATDASERQIASAVPHPRIEYRVAPAEASGLADASVDLVTSAQALHWFDLPAFYGEVSRVLRPEGIVAVWCYSFLQVEPGINAMLDRFYRETVGPYWPPERRWVEDGYRSMEFPFEELPVPDFAIESQLTLEGLAGYLGTWSATGRYIERHREDPVPALVEVLREPWGASPRAVRFPIAMRVGRSVGRSA